MALITTQARAELIGLYMGMFNAAPTADILSEMVAAKESGMTLEAIGNTLASDPDYGFSDVYPGLQTAEEFAEQLVGNLLAEDIDPGARDWAENWVVSQVTGTRTRVQVIIEALVALATNTNPVFDSSETQLLNKFDVATYYSVNRGLNEGDLLTRQGVLSEVTADAASVTAAKADVDLLAGNENNGTFNLSITTDTIIGTGGDDIINATTGLSNDGKTAITTTNALDSIDGGAGMDTLKIENTGDVNTLTGIITNVENLTFIGAGKVNKDLDVDVSAFSGTIKLQQTADDAKFTNVGSQTIALDKVAATAVTLDTTGATVSLSTAGATGAVSFDVTGTKTTTVDLVTDGKSATTVANTGAKITTANIEASSAAAVTVNGAALEAVTITGAGLVTLTAATAPTKSLDSSGSTGGVKYAVDLVAQQFTGGEGKDSVQFGATTKAQTLGGGDDTATISADFAVGGSVDAGAGSDTLKMTAVLAATLDNSDVFNGKVSNFEKLSVTGAASEDLNLANLDGVNYVIASGASADLKISGLASGGTVELVDASVKTTVSISDAATGTTDVLNVKLTNAASVDFGLLTAANTETVNINSDDTAVAPLKDGSVAHTLDLAADKATTVVVTGDAALVLDLTGSTKVTSVNASANLAGVEVDLSVLDKNVTALGSKGDDTITLGNQSTVTGGEGDDVFVVGVPVNGSSYSTITDMSEGDELEFDASAVAFEDEAIDLADTAVFQDFLDAATVGDGTDGTISWFQFGGNTYVVQDLDPLATFQNGVDAVVKLTGLVDLSEADHAAGVITL